MLLLLFGMLLFAVIGVAIANKKKISPVLGGIAGLFLGPLVFLMYLVNSSGIASADKRKCPMCAELVQAEALVCKHCGHKFGAVETVAVK